MRNYNLDMDEKPKQLNTRALIPAIVACAVVIAIGLALGLGIGLRSRDSDRSEEETGEGPTTEPPVSEEFKSRHGRYRFAAAATDAEKCSQIATEIMARNHGNAVDAAVAAVICGGLFNAHSSGIGGGAFFVVYNRTTRQAVYFNAREKAPAFATQDMFVKDPSLSTLGGQSIGVPGELKGLWEMHRRYGRLSWKTLLQPTIALCEEGSQLSKAQHDAAASRADVIGHDPEFSYLFDKNSDPPTPHPPGHIIFKRKLAQTLRVIANEGVSAFYNGSLTEDIIQDIRDNGGNITREDLLNYDVEIEDPVTLTLKENDLIMYSASLPGSGLVLEYMMNILSGYHFSPESVSTMEGSVLTYHRIVEAMKFAYAVRSELGDKNFLNISELMANMTSPEVGAEIRAKIDDDRTHDTSYYGPKFEVIDTPGTSHVSVVDANGNAVAVTSTINLYFGSKVKGTRTGIIFNNEMDDFSTPNTTNFFGVPASPANFISPGKRPLSSMSPTVAVDHDSGDVQMVVGAAGGTRITTAVALTLIKTLWFNETLQSAVDEPRLHHQLMPKEVQVETGFPSVIIDGLERKGHGTRSLSRSVVEAIHRTSNGYLDAVCDWRKGGAPDGY